MPLALSAPMHRTELRRTFLWGRSVREPARIGYWVLRDVMLSVEATR